MDVGSSPAASGTAAVNGTTLYYESAGSGPVVILLHGGNLDRRTWDDQFAALAAHYRVVRYDARGFGRSGAASAPFAAHDDPFALLQYLQIRHAALVGLSLGGRIAVDFTLAHPTMVDGLVLAGPGLNGWRWGPERDTTWRTDALSALARGDSVAAALAWLRSDYMRPAMGQPDLATRVRKLTADNASFWMWRTRVPDPEREASPAALGRLGEIKTPTLLIVGGEDTPDIRGIVDTLAANIAGARKVVYEGAGHMVNMEQPHRFTDDVLAFLQVVARTRHE
ncbi:MAG: alpha/beta fold hydrolase [Gemmatimonadota bacterium]|nr:alpha/beta fold hydrolase [Gemmatimonadota bacterium]